jgi:hypothetical protein
MVQPAEDRPGRRLAAPRAAAAPSPGSGGAVGAAIGDVVAEHRAEVALVQEDPVAGTLGRDCLDWLLILSRRHPEAVLREFVEHYNGARPHRALDLRAPLTRERRLKAIGEVVRRDRLGGLIHEYARRAA